MKIRHQFVIGVALGIAPAVIIGYRQYKGKKTDVDAFVPIAVASRIVVTHAQWRLVKLVYKKIRGKK